MPHSLSSTSFTSRNCASTLTDLKNVFPARISSLNRNFTSREHRSTYNFILLRSLILTTTSWRLHSNVNESWPRYGVADNLKLATCRFSINIEGPAFPFPVEGDLCPATWQKAANTLGSSLQPRRCDGNLKYSGDGGKVYVGIWVCLQWVINWNVHISGGEPTSWYTNTKLANADKQRRGNPRTHCVS